MRVYAYRECNDELGELKAFSLILSNQSNENRTELQRAGPGSEDCSGFVFPSYLISKGVIYADTERVYGISLLIPGQGLTKIGSDLKGTPILTEFNIKNQLIGFYGSYNDQFITSLGFLSHDPNCVRIPPPEPEIVEEIIVETNTEVTSAPPAAEEEGSSMGMLIIIIVVAILLIAGVVAGIIMKKKGINPFSKCKCKCRRRGGDDSTVGNMDDKINGSKDLNGKMSKKVIM